MPTPTAFEARIGSTTSTPDRVRTILRSAEYLPVVAVDETLVFADSSHHLCSDPWCEGLEFTAERTLQLIAFERMPAGDTGGGC